MFKNTYNRGKIFISSTWSDLRKLSSPLNKLKFSSLHKSKFSSSNKLKFYFLTLERCQLLKWRNWKLQKCNLFIDVKIKRKQKVIKHVKARYKPLKTSHKKLKCWVMTLTLKEQTPFTDKKYQSARMKVRKSLKQLDTIIVANCPFYLQASRLISKMNFCTCTSFHMPTSVTLTFGRYTGMKM